MSRFLTTTAALCFVVLGGLSIVARGLGTTLPPSAAVFGFTEGCEDKPQPCWFGVVPGKTTEHQIYQLMSVTGLPYSVGILAHGFSLVFRLPESWPYCHAIFNVLDGIIVREEISICRGPVIRVGDLAALAADQQRIVSLPPEELIYGSLAMHVKGWPALANQVTYITLLAPTTRYPIYPWHGYISKTRYCQLVPQYPACRLYS